MRGVQTSGLVNGEFVSYWKTHYDGRKYPAPFYERYGDAARNASTPEGLKDALLALLNWKDGKASGYISGKGKARANITKPVSDLSGVALSEFAKLFHAMAVANNGDFERCTENLRDRLTRMWRNGRVIPAFLLHIARPDRLPMVDQHTMRAFLWLTSRQIKDEPVITWNSWRDYVTFFEDTVARSASRPDVPGRCGVDHALMAFGKCLKALHRKALKKRALATPADKSDFSNLWDEINAEVHATARRAKQS